VDAAELSHRVVAVFEEDTLVEFLGASQSHGGVHAGVAGDVEVPDELVEEEPTQALARARIAGEQGPLYHFRQVDQGKHRAFEIRDVGPKDLRLVVGERLVGVGEHARATLRLARG
jgi:hypothetical protein